MPNTCLTRHISGKSLLKTDGFRKPLGGDILVANVNRQAKKPAKGGISPKKADSKVRKCRPPRRTFCQIKSDFVTKMPPQMGLNLNDDFKSDFPGHTF